MIKTLSPFHPWFITGFTDAEGCFYINITKNNKYKTVWYVEICFQIGLNNKDRAILEQIKNYFGVGNIYILNENSVLLIIKSPKELKVVIDHFDSYPLLTKKFEDYIFFKHAFDIVKNKNHLTEEGLKQIVAIKASLNWGLSETLREAFPDITPAIRPVSTSRIMLDPYWLVGFTTGEGCFFVDIFTSKTYKAGYQVKLKFQLTQHKRDEQLMKSLIEYFDCGNLYKDRECLIFIVTKFSDISEKIIPFFNKHTVVGEKFLNFTDWCRVAEIIKSKGHLTEEGLDMVIKIKAGMNTGRERAV